MKLAWIRSPVRRCMLQVHDPEEDSIDCRSTQNLPIQFSVDSMVLWQDVGRLCTDIGFVPSTSSVS